MEDYRIDIMIETVHRTQCQIAEPPLIGYNTLRPLTAPLFPLRDQPALILL
jgi:hypothetical protein